MIALEVEFLTGRYVATCFSDRRAPEWPPHPARLFSALVATAHEHEELTSAGRTALEWLERQGAPVVEATNAEARSAIAAYVPENPTSVLGGWSSAEQKLEKARQELDLAGANGDAKALKAAQKAVAKAEAKFAEQIAKAVGDDGKGNCAQAREMLPERRGRQPRVLPSLIPHAPKVRYSWPAAEPEEDIKEQLSELSRRLVRLGHSSSLVACRVLDKVTPMAPGMIRWRPSKGKGVTMRVVSEGQWQRLETAYQRHRGIEPRVLPAVHQTYEVEGQEASESAKTSVFGEWIVFREVSGEHARRIGLKLSRTEDITRALRGALLCHAEENIPEVLSGHDANARPLEQPHVAYVPLADVSSPYASGNILGVAVLLPRSIAAEDRRAVLRAIGRWEEAGLRLTLGRVGAMELQRIVDREPRKSLDPAWWTRPSRRWGSITPVALDRNPGNLYSSDPTEATAAARRAEEIVMQSCERIGLPAPRWVEIIRRSLFDAAPPARMYMPFPRKGSNGKGISRVCVHIEMCFEEPVSGPVLIGAGRYFGVGFCGGRG